jgi:hypothetical protein
LVILGILSFFYVSFSDPGFLVGDLKVTIDEKLMKSLEEVKIFKNNFFNFFTLKRKE